MRHLLPFLLIALASTACARPESTGSTTDELSASPAAARTSACVVIADNGDNVPFSKATAQHDHEYETLEVGETHGVQFMLKAGHGVTRLEARVNGKLVAATFYQTGIDSDNLRLDALAPNGTLVEAQCDHVDTEH
jgi:hypothetical protein